MPVPGRYGPPPVPPPEPGPMPEPSPLPMPGAVPACRRRRRCRAPWLSAFSTGRMPGMPARSRGSGAARRRPARTPAGSPPPSTGGGGSCGCTIGGGSMRGGGVRRAMASDRWRRMVHRYGAAQLFDALSRGRRRGASAAFTPAATAAAARARATTRNTMCRSFYGRRPGLGVRHAERRHQRNDRASSPRVACPTARSACPARAGRSRRRTEQRPLAARPSGRGPRLTASAAVK